MIEIKKLGSPAIVMIYEKPCRSGNSFIVARH